MTCSRGELAPDALTEDVAKYADATEARITIIDTGERAEVEIRDNGRGGADHASGSGLRGLIDRLGALGGHLRLESPLAVHGLDRRRWTWAPGARAGRCQTVGARNS